MFGASIFGTPQLGPGATVNALGQTIPSSLPGCSPCPTGYIGCSPYCAVDPAYVPPGTPGAPTVPPTTPPLTPPPACPSGQTWAPAQGLCVPYPGGVEPPIPTPATPPGQCPAGQTWDTAQQMCVATAAPAATEGPGWWQQRSTAEKAVIIGGGAVGALALVALLRQPSYEPNLRAKQSPSGIPIVKGKRWGHASPPKKYRRLGATKRSQYAYPERFMYPIHNRKHVARAKGRFTQYKHTYPPSIRREIARNLNRAARRVGLAADVKP